VDTIKQVYLDLGNVLVGLDFAGAARRLRQHTDATEDALLAAFRYNALHASFETGGIDGEAFIAAYAKQLAFRGEVAELEAIYREFLYPHQANIDFARELTAHYRVGLLSNTNAIHAHFMEVEMGLGAFTHPRIYSHTARSMKPDAAIYQAAIQAAGVPAGQCLFIDNKLENVEAARKTGMHALHFPDDTCLRTFWQEHV